MARRRDSRIRRVSRSLTAARTVIRSLFRCKTYDESISVLRRALDGAKLGHGDKLDGFSRLDKFARAIERQRQPMADVRAVIEYERTISPSLGGRTVFDDVTEETADSHNYGFLTNNATDARSADTRDPRRSR